MPTNDTTVNTQELEGASPWPGESLVPQSPVALLIIDMQNDFVLPQSPFCVAGAAPSVPAVQAALQKARAAGWAVFHIVREHSADGSDAEVFRRSAFHDGQGMCVSGSPGAALVDGLDIAEGEIKVVKTRFSGFFATPLDFQLRVRGVRTVLIAGTQYPNCVRGTAMDALYRDYHVVVLTDACSAKTPEVAAANVADLTGMGIACVPLAEAMKRVEADALLPH